jgi:crotonobetainyl-CoA:carnitine CoA-transferase CaiB-like acyl-CoA transferase
MDYVRASSDTPPAMSVPGMGDHMTACSLYGAIVTALYQREKTGQGCEVGSSLMANGLWSNGLMVQAALDGADTSLKQDYRKISPFTQLYRCRDERWLMLTILPQAQEKAWPNLATCLGHPQWLEDSRFDSTQARQDNKSALRELITQAIAQQDLPYWQQLFNANGITCGRVAETSDHCADEQVSQSGAVVNCAKGGRTVDSPLFVSGQQKRVPEPAPELGEHTQRIKTEFGIAL